MVARITTRAGQSGVAVYLERGPEPNISGGQRVLFYSGDDTAAKAEVLKILEGAGYFAVDLGALDTGGALASLPFGPLAGANFIKV